MQPHVLFEFQSSEIRDEFDERVQRTYTMFKQMIAGKSPAECQEIYSKFISQPSLTVTTTACQTSNVQANTTTTSNISAPTNSTPNSGIANNAPPLSTGSIPDNSQSNNDRSGTTNTTTPISPNVNVTSSVGGQNSGAQQPQQHTNLEELTMGILVATLCELELGQNKYFQDVIAFSKDNLTLFSTYLNMIIIERLTRLREPATKQVFWLTNRLIKSSSFGNGSEMIVLSIVRQVAGGDLTPKNLRLNEGLLELLIDNRDWITKSTSFMVPMTVYTFMRLLVDHLGPNQATLKKREIDFVVPLIREKFSECLIIGRDFLRMLHQINKIPEFESIWNDIFNNPKILHPNFQGPIQMLSTRTPRRLILSRLTFDMERKLSFLATQVKFGNQKKYQEWFHKQYFSTPESLSLRCDVIRYICTIIHPSNEVLCSDIIPRWAIIGWLLATCTTNTSTTYSRIALYYDWLVYDAKADNIMNIEPGILVMYYSARSHPNVTANLLDFFCRLPVLFIPKLSEQVRIGIKKSLNLILEKRVIPSLGPLFDNPKHDPALKALLKENFPEFCAQTPVVANPPIIDNGISTTPQQQQQQQPLGNATNSSSASATPSTNVAPNSKQDLAGNIDSSQKLNSSNDSAINNVTTDGPVIDSNTKDQSINNITSRVNEFGDTTDNKTIVDHSTPVPPSANDLSSSKQSNFTNDNLNCQALTNNDSKKLNSARKTLNSQCTASNSSIPLDGQKNNAATITSQDNVISLDSNPPFESPSNESPKVVHSPDVMIIEDTRIQIANNNNRESSSVKVIYPFMVVPHLDFTESINTFDDDLKAMLDDLNKNKCNQTRCNIMEKLISTVFDTEGSASINDNLLKELGHCLAYIFVDDFSTKILSVTSSNNNHSSKNHDAPDLPTLYPLTYPLFNLCRHAYIKSKAGSSLRTLIVYVFKNLEATGFLILYFLRVNALTTGANIALHYVDFCKTAKRSPSTKILLDDLVMALTYDAELFCFLLPSVFGELATCGPFSITGNISIIKLVVSSIDPIHLQEMICLCLTGTAKVINKEDVLPLIEASLEWESWEQFCVWKLISAQSVPIENFISILPKLNTRAHSEAMSSILLKLQSVTQPTTHLVQTLINCEFKQNDPFVSSILRYWSMKTDVRDLARLITSLVDTRPPSPPLKRKGPIRSKSNASTSLTPQTEKILYHLESIRQRAPKNKLLAQPEIIEMISQLEGLCNETQKRTFSDLFLNRPKAAKKQKKVE